MEGLAPVNHKRVYRIMAKNSLLLARRHRKRPGHVHDGKVVAIRSNLRWCSDGFEFTCWNGEVIRAAFILDTHDREAIAWRAVAGAGISGSDVRDMMLEAVEKRFGACRAPEQIEMLSDNGSAYTAKDTRVFAAQIGLKACFTPIASPESNGVSEAFVKTIKRDYVARPAADPAFDCFARRGPAGRQHDRRQRASRDRHACSVHRRRCWRSSPFMGYYNTSQ